MLTPVFKLNQDAKTIIVTIKAPYTSIKNAEIDVIGKELTFYSTPYYLRLHLPERLQDSEQDGCSASYDADCGEFVVICNKETPGQHFPGLDMLASLLTPRGNTNVTRPRIEVFNSQANSDEQSGSNNEASSCQQNGVQEDSLEEFSSDCEFLEPQELPVEMTIKGYKYGFADSHSGVFTSLKDELCGVIDLKNPDNTSPVQRAQLRHEDETLHFSWDHYLADLFDGEAVVEALAFRPRYWSMASEDVLYTEEENLALLQLPRRELLVEGVQEERRVGAGLVSLVLAWAYNHRINAGEDCKEAAWNIAKLTPQLCWLDTAGSVRAAVRVFARRCVVFPLLRSFQHTQAVVRDAAKLLALGRKQVLKCLLEIQHVFNETENYYLLNQLYITDYCIWIQTFPEEKLGLLLTKLEQVDINKEDLDLHLEALEKVGKSQMEEEEEGVSEDTASVSVDAAAETSVGRAIAVAAVMAAPAVTGRAEDTSPQSVRLLDPATSQAPKSCALQSAHDAQVEEASQTLGHLTFHNPLASSDCTVAAVAAVNTTNVAATLALNNNNNNNNIQRQLRAPISDDSDSEDDSETDSDCDSEADTDSSDDSSSSSDSSDSSDSSSEPQLDSDDDDDDDAVEK